MTTCGEILPSKSRRLSVIKIAAIVLIFLAFAFYPPLICESWSLHPEEVLVVANVRVLESLELARYYMKKRHIPAENLIILSQTDQERCRKGEYLQNMVTPLRLFFALRKPSQHKYRCLVTMFGTPLTVYEPRAGIGTTLEIWLLKVQGLAIRLLMALGQEAYQEHLVKRDHQIKNNILHLQRTEDLSAVDSEIALVHRQDSPLFKWLPNPLFLSHAVPQKGDQRNSVLMVSRLDGPSPAIVRRMIDDSLAAETKGLRGKAYFDARWPDPGDKELSGYAWYDRSLHLAAQYIRSTGMMDVIAENSKRLFQPGQCPRAALYCGWYSLEKYVAAFQWVPGAVGYHMASFECRTLRDPKSTAWCKSMLTAGAAAVIGPVGEPFIQAFPPPNLFFSLLIKGDLSLAECFAFSNPFLSWRMILIGDPLYRPFKARHPHFHPLRALS